MPRSGPAATLRLVRIHERLSSGRSCTAASIAQELEVSTRTIRRDITSLRDSFGAPIEWEPTTKTWFYSGPYDGPLGLHLNTAEALALILAEQSFRRLRGSPIATALHAILEKIADTAGENTRHSWQSLAAAVYTAPVDRAATREQHHFTPIADAIRKNHILEIHYTKPDASRARLRCIHPLALAELDQRWTIIAYDPAADGIRKFLLARIERCRRLPDTFEPPQDFDLHTYLVGSVGLFTGDTAFMVEAELSAYAANYLRESPWHPSQTLTTLPDGNVLATWQVNHLLDIQRKLLSWGEHATILGPPELREAFATIAKDFLKKYPPPTGSGHSLSGVE